MRKLTEREIDKVKQIAWVVCNVSDCDGTRAHPCTSHYEAADRLWRDVTSTPKT